MILQLTSRIWHHTAPLFTHVKDGCGIPSRLLSARAWNTAGIGKTRDFRPIFACCAHSPSYFEILRGSRIWSIELHDGKSCGSTVIFGSWRQEVFKLIRRHSPQTSDTISRTVTMEDWWEIMRSIWPRHYVIEWPGRRSFLLDCLNFLTYIFTVRRNVRIASIVLATAIPSVCPSVRPSVCLSHAGIVSKRPHVARCSLHCQIAKCV